MSEAASHVATRIDTVVFDVDGTLVDSNYHHAIAWFRAFRRFGITPVLWQIHRAIGMGGDKLVDAVAGDEVEQKYGDKVRAAWEKEFAELLPEVQPLPGARQLLVAVHERGVQLVLASSGKREHVEHYLDQLDTRELADDWTTSDDAEESKPAPDLLQVAMAKVDAGRAVMIGDATWDAEAAKRAGIPAVAVRTGGFSDDELRNAGAVGVYHSLADLEADLDRVLQRG